LLVESGGERLLVDCGPDLRHQLLSAGVGELSAVLVTHDHADHCHGIDELRAVAQRRGAAIPLHARKAVLDSLERRFGYIFSGSGMYPPICEAIPLGERFAFGMAGLRFVDQPHGEISSVGVRFDEGSRSAVYAIDFSTLTDEMAVLYEGTEVMIADCLQRRPHPTHAHLDAVLGWAKDLNVGQLYLSHMNNSMDYATLAAELPDWAAPAYDGLEIELR
jgi:phosphoribosyl 1,2-cyclic phosphate phosphodiesterase